MSALRRDWIFLPILALFPLLLYALEGYGGHDFAFHVASWIELHHTWSAHEWVLGWSQQANYGLGDPRFCFYPPVSLIIAACFTFLIPLRFVPGVMVWIVLSLGGLAMYIAAGQFLPRKPRLFAAILYMFNPYLLVTVISRYAIAEAWVQALLPLILLCFGIAERSVRGVALLSCFLALGWLTNIPESIVVFYALGLLAVVLSIRSRSFRPLLAMAVSQTTAFGLAAFRLFPAFQEKAWVSSRRLLIHDFKDYMPGRHQLNIVLFCSIYMATAFALALLAAWQSVRARKSLSTTTLCFVTLAIVAVLFELPISTLLWETLPELTFVQFPFRFLPLLSFASTLLLFEEAVSPSLRKIGVTLFLLFAIGPFVNFCRSPSFPRFPSFDVAVTTWQGGYEAPPEYVPIAVAGGLEARENALRAQGPFASSACQPSLLTSLPDEKIILTNARGGCTLTLNTFYYPFWKATLESGSPLPVTANSKGLLAVGVPVGPQRITLTFIPETRTRTIAAYVSFITFLILVLWGAVERYNRPKSTGKANVTG